MSWRSGSQNFLPSVGISGEVLQEVRDGWASLKWANDLILIAESVWLGCAHE